MFGFSRVEVPDTRIAHISDAFYNGRTSYPKIYKMILATHRNFAHDCL